MSKRVYLSYIYLTAEVQQRCGLCVEMISKGCEDGVKINKVR